MNKKYFTIEEANELIPTLEYKMPRLLQMKRDIATFVTMLTKKGIKVEELFAMTDTQDDELLSYKEKLDRLSSVLHAAMAEIQELGCLVKDMDLGLIDFYGMHNGEEVFYCWQMGESKIRYWHKASEGFSKRQPLYDEEDSEQKVYH